MDGTTRDRVWTYTLKILFRNNGSKTAAEIADIADCSERTARDTLHHMEKVDLVQRELVDGKVKFRKIPDAFEADL